MDMLVAGAPGLGAPLIAAEYPRAWLDLNRSPEELDPGVVEGVMRVVPDAAHLVGVGGDPAVVANGRAIYRGKISRAEAEARIAQVLAPLFTRRFDGLNVRGAARFVRGGGCWISTRCRTRRWTGRAPPAGRVRRWCWATGSGHRRRPSLVDVLEDAFLSEGLSVDPQRAFRGRVRDTAVWPPLARAPCGVRSRSTGRSTMNERLLRPSGNFDAMKRIITNVIDG